MRCTPFILLGFPGDTYNAGNPGVIPGSGGVPGEGNGNPLQYACLENSLDGGAWWATVQGFTHDGVTNTHTPFLKGFPGDSDGKESSWNAGDPASIPES